MFRGDVGPKLAKDNQSPYEDACEVDCDIVGSREPGEAACRSAGRAAVPLGSECAECGGEGEDGEGENVVDELETERLGDERGLE